MRTESTSLLFTRPGLDTVVSLYARDAQKNRFYPRFVEMKKSNHGFYQIATEGDFPTANPVDPGGPINFDDFATPYYKQVQFQKYAIGYAQDDLVTSSDLYGIFARRGPKMVDATYRACEYDMADLLNLGTTTQVTTPDGVAFFSASHLYALGTFSNIVSGNPVLSITSLATAQMALMNQPSHEGNPMTFEGPKKLLVPIGLHDRAWRLCNTVEGRQPNSGADADKNWAGRQIEVVSNPFWTFTAGWALVTNEASKNPMQMIERRGIVTKSQEDISRDGTLSTVTMVWGKAPFDPRGIVWSAGS